MASEAFAITIVSPADPTGAQFGSSFAQPVGPRFGSPVAAKFVHQHPIAGFPLLRGSELELV